jgi:hypothetical protein
MIKRARFAHIMRSLGAVKYMSYLQQQRSNRMNRPTFVRTIAHWLSRCLPALAIAVTLAAWNRPPQPPPGPQPSADLEVHITVNWNS